MIPDGSLLVHRPVDFIGKIISLGEIRYREWIPTLFGYKQWAPCHISRAIWWDKSLWTVQQTANPYKHLIRLSECVYKHPGNIDLYILRDQYKEHYSLVTTLETHKTICLRPYGWRNLLSVIPRHLLGLRKILSKNLNDKFVTTRPPFCSMAFAMSDRAGGIDPCPNLADSETEPIDLANSHCYEYICTLI